MLIYIGNLCYLYYTSEQDIQLLLNVANLKQVTYLLNNKGELRLDYIAFTIKFSNFYIQAEVTNCI